MTLPYVIDQGKGLYHGVREFPRGQGFIVLISEVYVPGMLHPADDAFWRRS